MNAQNETVNSHTIAVLVDNEPGVLARPCVPQAHGNTDSGLVWLGRYLDYRCHVPQQPGTVRLPAPLRRCLQSLARSGPGSRVVADALGADDAARPALARRAASLLAPGGIEAAVLALAGGDNQARRPPCRARRGRSPGAGRCPGSAAAGATRRGRRPRRSPAPPPRCTRRPGPRSRPSAPRTRRRRRGPPARRGTRTGPASTW